MGVRDSPDFEENLTKLKYLINQREEAWDKVDQKYLTIESMLDRLDVLESAGLLDGKRVLAIGDADMTGLAIAIFGNPSEVVVADIDSRLSEIYFDATMEYDLPVRFVYHDMRIKMIAILKKQYSLVLTEPPATEAGIDLFISRALEILEPGENNQLIVSVPSSGTLRQHFDELVTTYGMQVAGLHPKLNKYMDDSEPSDLIELTVPDEIEPKLINHFVRPLYTDEVNKELHEYKCICKESIIVGPGTPFPTIEELESQGCPFCGHKGVFAYKSEIELK